MKSQLNTLLRRVSTASRESMRVDFKSSFDDTSARDWCELVKDLIAMINSGGGVILLGVNDAGSISGWHPAGFLKLDPAKLTDQIAKYTQIEFDDFDIKAIDRSGATCVGLVLNSYHIPIVFTRPGTYSATHNKQATAFGQGTLYFRHGAKSEPARPGDLEEFLKRELFQRRREILSNVKKVVAAPRGHLVQLVVPNENLRPQPEIMRFRLTDDPSAPELRELDIDATHPHRQKEVLEIVNKHLMGHRRINSFDLQCVKTVHDIAKQARFIRKPRFGTPQYSNEFVEWLTENYFADVLFFEHARSAFRSKQRSSRAKVAAN